MSAGDVKDTLAMAIEISGVEKVKLRHKPRLLSDNGACYVSRDLQIYLENKGISHTRGKPYHPMTQGKVERYHRTMKNIIKLQNYYLPWELEQEIDLFVSYYNHERVHESLDNMTPADVYYGRHGKIKELRVRVKEQTLEQRRRKNLSLMPLRDQGIRPATLRESVS
jgi:putative transposase